STNPNTVLPLRWGHDLYLHTAGSKSCYLLAHTICNPRKHGGPATKHHISIKILTDIHVTLHDGVIRRLVNSRSFHPDQRRLEEDLRAAEPLGTYGDDLPVGQLVAILGSLDFLFEVNGNICKFLLHVTNDFPFGSCCELVASFGQDLHKIIGEITASKVQTKDGVWEGVALVNRDKRVRDAQKKNVILKSVFHNNLICSPTGIEGKDSLDSNIHSWHIEGLKHDLSHFLSVGLWVERSFCEQNRVLLRSHTKFIVESVMPDFLHVIPVADYTMLNWIFQCQNTSFGLSLVTYISILLPHPNHHACMPWTTNYTWKNCSWGIITSKSSL
ncbi:ribosomal RNA large subunit methyltransferase G, partial [Striga asiatica]